MPVVSNRLAIRNYASSAILPLGGTSTIFIPNTSGLTPGTNSFGVSFWVKFNEQLASGTHCLVQMDFSAYQNGWLLSQNGTSLVVFIDNAAASVTVTNFFVAPQLYPNEWNNIFVTVNASDLKVRVYLNGALINTSAAIAAWNIVANISTRVGASQFATANNIAFSDVIFYGPTIPVLSDVVAYYFNNVAPPPGAINRYILNDGAGTNAADSIGGNSGTLTNSAAFQTDSPMKSRKTP